MLWSGGKDSYVAYSIAATSICTDPSDWIFVTLVPPRGGFMCHPLGMLERHSRALDVDHLFAVVDVNDWEASYATCFRHLRDGYGVRRFFTGDVLLTAGQVEDYWLRRMLGELGLELTLPLAGMYVGPLLARIEGHRIEAVVTGVADWVGRPEMLGSRISLELLHEHGLYRDPYLDLAGEQGEYHTTVVAANGHRFASTEELDGTRTRVGGLDVNRMSDALYELTSPRLDLAELR